MRNAWKTHCRSLHASSFYSSGAGPQRPLPPLPGGTTRSPNYRRQQLSIFRGKCARHGTRTHDPQSIALPTELAGPFVGLPIAGHYMSCYSLRTVSIFIYVKWGNYLCCQWNKPGETAHVPALDPHIGWLTISHFLGFPSIDKKLFSLHSESSTNGYIVKREATSVAVEIS